MSNPATLDDFYRKNGAPLPRGITRQIGHFNVFEAEKLFDKATGNRIMPYNRRAYYKISWLNGKSRVEYADRVINVGGSALLFATPKIPYHWIPADGNQTGMFCIFTDEFLAPQATSLKLDAMPIFMPGQYPVFQLTEAQQNEVQYIFKKMQRELAADYQFKYDLLRAMVTELIHFGQKLQPLSAISTSQNAAERIATLFIELLERQFPVDPGSRQLHLRSAKHYADQLSVHVNHLNKALKEVTGYTTSQHIAHRMAQEAKILLKQTDSHVAQIAYALGFDDQAHFSTFFKKHTSCSPTAFREPATS